MSDLPINLGRVIGLATVALVLSYLTAWQSIRGVGETIEAAILLFLVVGGLIGFAKWASGF